MRLKGKKPIFNYSDTFSLDQTLSPIIAEGLKKFLEVIKQDKCVGVPHSILTENSLDSDNEDHLQMGMGIWHSEIEQIIFAFDLKNEPDILDYDFDYDIVEQGKDRGRFHHSVIEMAQENPELFIED